MSERVLVVDQNEPIRQMLLTILRSAGYAVASCAGAEDAIAEFVRHEYDAVVLAVDTGNPRSHADLLAALPPSACVILTSAGSQWALDALESDSIVARFRKPFAIVDLLSAVRACFAAHRAELKLLDAALEVLDMESELLQMRSAAVASSTADSHAASRDDTSAEQENQTQRSPRLHTRH